MTLGSLTIRDKKPVTDGVWQACLGCAQPIFTQSFIENLHVCPHCNHHHRLSARERMEQLFDAYTWVAPNKIVHNPLSFVDSKSYDERFQQAQKGDKDREALMVSEATLGDYSLVCACFDFTFIGGSMGIAVGERFVQAAMLAMEKKIPLLCITASGGARMQEGVFSLLQMGKVSSVIGQLHQAHIPYVVLLTDPTTGGVSASLAALGDVTLAEPNALIGFTGPRVIEQTVRQKLPPGFQRSEFLLKAGLIDQIVNRSDLKAKLEHFLRLLGA